MNTFQFESQKNCNEIFNEIEAWITNKELNELICFFGGDLQKEKLLKERIVNLVEFSEVWDFRGKQKQISSDETEKARWTISQNQLDKEQSRLAYNAAEKLGLIGCTVPAKKAYDYILVLGGARMSCLFRMKYAKEVCEKYNISAKAIVGLAGMRKIGDSEREATDTYAPNAMTEFDLMKAALENVFDSLEIKEKEDNISENANESWAMERYVSDIPITLLAAPSREPEKRRANTADTFAFFMEKLNVGTNKNILLITSQIYVPYQQMEAIRMLGITYGHSLETIGFPNEWSAKLQGLQNPENYLQEIRSVLQSMGRLLKEWNK